MKKITAILAIFFLLTPVFANLTENDLVKDFTKSEISRALADYKASSFDENGSAIYKEAYGELQAGAVKSAHDEYMWGIGILVALLASSISSNAYNNAVSGCIDRCVRFDNLPYSECRRDCNIDPHTH